MIHVISSAMWVKINYDSIQITVFRTFINANYDIDLIKILACCIPKELHSRENFRMIEVEFCCTFGRWIPSVLHNMKHTISSHSIGKRSTLLLRSVLQQFDNKFPNIKDNNKNNNMLLLVVVMRPLLASSLPNSFHRISSHKHHRFVLKFILVYILLA